MGFRLLLAIIITVLFSVRRKASFKIKVLFHPILLTPLVGWLLGTEGLITGVTVGVIVELIWGSNLVDYDSGLKYGLLVSLLTVVLTVLTNNISLFLNLGLVVILVFSFQESLGLLEDNKYFILIVFTFNLLMLSGVSLISSLLGWIPAQFLNDLSISGGALVPIVGLAVFLIQAIKPTFKRDNIWYYSYAIAVVVTSVLLFNKYYWGVLIFPILWHILYYFWDRTKVLIFKEYLRFALVLLVVIMTPLIIELSSPFIEGNIQYILWTEVVLTLIAILRLFKLTAVEGYFIMTLLGVIGAKLGILL